MLLRYVLFRLLFLLIPMIGWGNIAGAQTTIIDGLKKAYYGNADKHYKLRALAALYEQYQTLPKDTLWKYAIEGKRLANEVSDKLSYSLAVTAQADAYLRWGNVDSAMALITPELAKNKVADAATRPLFFKLSFQKVDCYGDASNFTDALDELYRIMNLADQYHDSLTMGKSTNVIGVINYNLDHVPEAFSWYFKGLSFTAQNPSYKTATAALYINLAETYRWVAKLDSSEYYITKAIALCNEAGNLYYLCNALRVKAGIYKGRKQYEAAEEIMRQCIAIRETIEGEVPRSNELLALSNIYLQHGKVDEAIKILTTALSQRPSSSPHEEQHANGADLMQMSYLNTLARAYDLKGDHTNYEQVLQHIIAAKDSFYEINSAKAIAELKTKYDVQKKEATIANQKLDIIRKDYILYGTVIFSLFLVLFATMLFVNYRKRQRYKMLQMMEEEKLSNQLAIAAAEEKERVRIAADLHDNLGAYAASITANLDHISTDGQTLNEIALKELKNNAQSIVSQLSDTIWVLKKDELYLTAISDRLKIFIQKIQASYPQMVIDIDEDISQDQLLSSAQAFHLFKILQEAVTNALKHSKGTSINVFFSSTDSWEVSITDNGVGLKEQAIRGNGLRSMQQRASEAGWQINWSLNNNGGTKVVIRPTIN